MKKLSFCLLSLLFMQVIAFGQQPRLLTLDQLNARLKKGKDTVFVINFWATWCGPCGKELPDFERLNKEYGDGRIKVLLVSVDFISKFRTSVIPFVKKNKLKSEVFLLNEKDQQEYINRIDSSWSGSLPATLFIRGENRKFKEGEFTYSSLVKEYQTLKTRS